MKKKLFGIVLSVILAMTMCLPVTAFAGETPADNGKTPAASAVIDQNDEAEAVPAAPEAKANVDKVLGKEKSGDASLSYYGGLPTVDGVDVIPFTTSKIEVYWNPVDDYDCEGYYVIYSKYKSFSNAKYIDVDDSDANYCCISGLKSGTRYYAGVIAYGWDENGNYVESDEYYYDYATPSANKVTINGWYNTGKLKITSAKLSYGTNNTLIVKVKLLNKTGKKVNYIYGSYIDIYDDWDDCICSKYFGKKKVAIKKNRSKWITFKIPYKYQDYLINLRYDIGDIDIGYKY